MLPPTTTAQQRYTAVHDGLTAKQKDKTGWCLTLLAANLKANELCLYFGFDQN